MPTKPATGAVVAGASSGLGRAIALELTAAGYHVSAIGRDQQRLESLVSAADGAAGGTLVRYQCELSSQPDVQLLAERIRSESPPIQLLFLVSGAPASALISNIDAKLFEHSIAANLTSVVYLTSALLDDLKRNAPSSVVGILSTAALNGRANEAAYAAAKWGARGFLECLRTDCKGTGVRVVSVFPGGISTPFWDKDTYPRPDTSTFMAPRDVALAAINAATGVGDNGYVSSLTIERG